MDDTSDVVVVGAGPTGMACAIEAQRAGLSALLIDKGCVVNSLFHYPANLVFFTTPQLLEIGDIPFPSPNVKPTPPEALAFYPSVAQKYQSKTRQYGNGDESSGSAGDFSRPTSHTRGCTLQHSAPN